MDDKAEELTTAYQEGQLIDAAYKLSRGSKENRKAISTLLSELHNKGDIDLLKSYLSLSNNSQTGPDFFLSRRLFEKALPALKAPVEQVMLCIQHLASEAGNDLAANTVFGPFIEFLAVDSTRPLRALEVIRESPVKVANFVSPVIIAGTRTNLEEYFGYATELVTHEIPDVSINAIYSLGRISYAQTSYLPVRAIEEIKRISEEHHDDRYMAVVIKTASSLAKLDASLVEPAFTAVTNALRSGSDQALHAATEVFGFEANDLPDELLNLLISNLPRVKAENGGSINNIDFGISALFKKDKNRAIGCLEKILLSNPDTLSLKAFDSFIHEILSADLATLNHMLTRWFIRGDRVLCTAITEMIEPVHGNQLSMEIDPQALPNNDPVTLIFLARKAIGYLFFKPVSVSSILISLLRAATDEDVMKELEELLLDPLLLNYPGSAREFLEARISKEPEHVSVIIESVLKRLEEYLEKIRSIEDVPELLPALRQREAYMRNFNRQMSESYKQAMKGSIVEMIATKSVILYGRSSINYVRQATSSSSRMEIPMQAHSVEMEFPRRHNLDPFGLDYLLRVFRAERMVGR
ncbi:MAG: hypothetical protein AB2728_20520 [Candidatus Thiodiazotropha sp.]